MKHRRHFSRGKKRNALRAPAPRAPKNASAPARLVAAASDCRWRVAAQAALRVCSFGNARPA